jgi:hypothetical protein
MDDRQFDRIARVLGRATSRRAALGGLIAAAGAGLIGASVASAGPAPTATPTPSPTPTSTPTPTPTPRPVRRTCRPVFSGCLRNSQCCNNFCDTRRTTPRNQRNRCACPEGIVTCRGVCCAEGEECIDGVCAVPPPCGGLTCSVDDADLGSVCAITCSVTTACEIVNGCEMRIWDPNNWVVTACQTDDDCADSPVCTAHPGSPCMCALGYEHGIPLSPPDIFHPYEGESAPYCVVIAPEICPC